MNITLLFHSDLNSVSKFLKQTSDLDKSYNFLVSGTYVFYQPIEIPFDDKEIKIYAKFEGYLSREGNNTKLAGKTKMILTGKRFVSLIGPVSPEIIIMNLGFVMVLLWVTSFIPFVEGFWGWGILSIIVMTLFSIFIYNFFKPRLVLYKERCELLKKNLMNIETSFNKSLVN